MELLSRVGLNDAFLFVRRYNQLSDGQKYHYRIAKIIEAGRHFWVMDEFSSTLDRNAAKIVARYNPFFERAGLTKIAESKPNPEILNAVEKLRSLGFNPVFLTSEKANLQKLREMPADEVQRVRYVFKEISAGVYRKRLWSSHQAYMSKEKFNKCVDKASLKKLAKMLRILGFLTQIKVYLFWTNPAFFN